MSCSSRLVRAIECVAAVMLSAGAQGCVTSALTLETTPHFAEYRASWGSDVTLVAEGCGVRLFGLVPIAGDASLARAMQKLMSESANRALAYVTVDVRHSFYLIATEECTIVTGHFIDGSVDSQHEKARERSSEVDADRDDMEAGESPALPSRVGEDGPALGGEDGRTTSDSVAPSVVTFSWDQPGGLRAARRTLGSWTGREVQATTKSGSTARGTFRGIRGGYVAIRTADGALWTKQMLEVTSIELLD